MTFFSTKQTGAQVINSKSMKKKRIKRTADVVFNQGILLNLQRYPSHTYLNNIVEDIVVFISYLSCIKFGQSMSIPMSN